MDVVAMATVAMATIISTPVEVLEHVSVIL